MAKAKYTSGVTVVTAEALSLPANDPRVIGHVHNGVSSDGHASKINLVSHVTGLLQTSNIAASAITSVKIVDSTITEAKLAFSITDPIVGPETFVYRPSGTGEGSIYNDSSELSGIVGLKVI